MPHNLNCDAASIDVYSCILCDDFLCFKLVHHLILLSSLTWRVCFSCVQNPYLMLLQLLPFSSLLSSQFLRWDIFLLYGRQVGLWIMEKVGRLWGVSFQFYIVVFVSIVWCKLISHFNSTHSFLVKISFLMIYWRFLRTLTCTNTMYIPMSVISIYFYVSFLSLYLFTRLRIYFKKIFIKKIV